MQVGYQPSQDGFANIESSVEGIPSNLLIWVALTGLLLQRLFFIAFRVWRSLKKEESK